MLVVVNSFVNSTAVSRLLLQLSTLNISTVHVSGGEKQTFWYRVSRNVQRLDVRHNSIDNTGLIALLEHPRVLDNHSKFFYLHDTTMVTDLFRRKLAAYNSDMTCALRSGPSMNMGIYNSMDLQSVRQQLLSMRSTDQPNLSESQSLKKRCVSLEDLAFEQIFKHRRRCFLTSRVNISRANMFVWSSTKRRCENYTEWGILKYKANWNIKQSYILESRRT